MFSKKVFVDFPTADGAWGSLRDPISQESIKRRECLFDTQKKICNVQAKRQAIYRSDFLLSQLPDSPFTGNTLGEGEGEIDYDVPQMKQTAYTSAIESQRMQSSHRLQEYQMQLMLMEQKTKKRLMMERQLRDEQEGNMLNHAPPRN